MSMTSSASMVSSSFLNAGSETTSGSGTNGFGGTGALAGSVTSAVSSATAGAGKFGTSREALLRHSVQVGEVRSETNNLPAGSASSAAGSAASSVTGGSDAVQTAVNGLLGAAGLAVAALL